MLKNLIARGKKASLLLSVLTFVAMMQVTGASAANADLDAVVTDLTEGIGDLKTNALTIIGILIGIIITIFGIGWLVRIFKKKMSAAS